MRIMFRWLGSVRQARVEIKEITDHFICLYKSTRRLQLQLSIQCEQNVRGNSLLSVPSLNWSIERMRAQVDRVELICLCICTSDQQVCQ